MQRIARPEERGTPPHYFSAYTYDQLNRIRFAKNAKKDQSGVLAFNDYYASAYKYDQDGNLKALLRKEGTGQLMDNLSYYYPQAGQNNKLANVLDSATFTQAGVEDLKPYLVNVTGASAPRRMGYDEDGNLIHDLTSATDSVKWNIYGKTTDVLNTTAKLNEHFIYDGSGQRVSKNQTIITDTGHVTQNTYYVRDASGNILAEYNSRQVYREGDGLTKMTPLSDYNIVQKGTLIQATHELGYDLDPAFIQVATMDGARKMTPYPAGYYLGRDPELMQRFMGANATTLMGDLNRYSNATGNYPLGDATLMAIDQEHSTDQLSRLAQAVLNAEDPDVRQHALGQLSQTIPALYMQMANEAGLEAVNNADDSTLVAERIAVLAHDDPGYFSSRIMELYNQSADNPELRQNAVSAWVQAVTSDSLYFTDDLLGGAELGGMLYGNILRYGDKQAEAAALKAHEADPGGTADKSSYGIYAFVSSLPNSMDLLAAITDVSRLDLIDYGADPVGYLNEVTDNGSGTDLLDSALSALGNKFDAGAFRNKVLTLKPDAGVETKEYSGGLMLQQQSITLASHHIYGSSRLGIAGYWPGQYTRSWDYVSKVTDTMRLCGNQPWYSGSYNDVITQGLLTPYNQTFTGTALAQNILGQKQYELTNHLGNVQSTVSDRRYVANVNNTPVFRAGVAAAYDYYPFGMLMPGRFVNDNAGHEVTLTQIMMVPQTGLVAAALSSAAGMPYNEHPLTMSSSGGVVNSVGVTGRTGGFTINVQVTPGQPTSLQVAFGYVYGYTTITVTEQLLNGTINTLKSLPVNYANTYILQPFTPTMGTVKVTIGTMSSYLNAPAGGLFVVNSVGLVKTTLVPQTVVTTINNGGTDPYEFGSGGGGQLKSNEIAGTGNHYTALFWEYDPRTGRRWNLDPKPEVAISQYAVMLGNPILHNDVLGDQAGQVLGNHGCFHPNVPPPGASAWQVIKNFFYGTAEDAAVTAAVAYNCVKPPNGPKIIILKSKPEIALSVANTALWFVPGVGEEAEVMRLRAAATGRKIAWEAESKAYNVGLREPVREATVVTREPVPTAHPEFVNDVLRMTEQPLSKTTTVLSNEFLSNVQKMSREEVMSAVQEAGFKETYRDGDRVNFNRSDMNIRFDPPDELSKTYHVHVERGTGYKKISYDANLNIVKKNSPAAHMETQAPQTKQP